MADTKSALERARGALARVREVTNARAKKIQFLGVGLIATYAFGAWEKSTQHAGSGVTIPTVFGLDHLMVWGLAGYLGGEMVGGTTGEVLEAAGFGILCAYAHKAGSAA